MILVAAAILTLAAGCTAAPASNAATDAAPSASSASTQVGRPTDAAAPATDDPMATCDGVVPEGDPVLIAVQAQSIAFDAQVIEGPSHCQPFVIEFTNLDEPSPVISEYEHNIFIRLDGVLGSLAFEGETIGTGTVRYEVPGLPAGTHYFYCSLHAAVMKGDLVVAAAGS